MPKINIFHPGYDDALVPLLLFRGFDSKEGDLWHDFAHTACAIITNNRFDGYLSTSRDSQSSHVSGDLLAPGNYWWHLPGGILSEMRYRAIVCLRSLDSSEPYAIIADFRDWQYSQYVPENWRSQTLEREKAENACQLSQDNHSLNKAHIVPSSETMWFNKNGLNISYGAQSSRVDGPPLDIGIDDENNMLLLRSDLHHAWDQRKFAFVPKGTKDSKIVVHCWVEDMVSNYHNLPLQGFVCREMLLARFAWTLLPRAVTSFLMATSGSRMIWTRDNGGKLVPQRKTETDCSTLATAPLARSTSPKKRKQNENGQQSMTTRIENTRRSFGSSDSGIGSREEEKIHYDDEDSDAESQYSMSSEEFTRGRKRVRTGEL